MKNETQSPVSAKKEYQSPVLSELGAFTELTLDGGAAEDDGVTTSGV